MSRTSAKPRRSCERRLGRRTPDSRLKFPASGKESPNDPRRKELPPAPDDLAARRVATIRGPASGALTWNGISADGRPAKGGLYLYRLEIGTERHEGKFVLVR